MTRELIIECMTCKEECEEENSCFECAENQLDEYEAQIKLDVLRPIAKMIDDYACGHELHVISAINLYIYQQTREKQEQKNE